MTLEQHAEKKTVDHFLRRAGFSGTDDQAGLFAQLGYCVRDHYHFRQLIDHCEPAERPKMYAALTPHLKFTAKPLDVYIAELRDLAERKQLPCIAADGNLKAFQAGEITSDEYAVNEAIRQERAKERLILTCRKCTVQQEFVGARKVDAIYLARSAGWSYDEVTGTGREICPKCPGGSASKKHLN